MSDVFDFFMGLTICLSIVSVLILFNCYMGVMNEEFREQDAARNFCKGDLFSENNERYCNGQKIVCSQFGCYNETLETIKENKISDKSSKIVCGSFTEIENGIRREVYVRC